jgi:hypothetical protein
MKRKLFLLFACMTFFVQAIYAQDIILKRTGDEIKVTVTEVSTEYVKYKKFEYLTGPVHNISVSEIFMIKYEDDSRDVFEKNQVTGKIQIKHHEAEKISLPQMKQVSNGTFEMLAFDGASVSFRAVVETPVYSVSQVSDGRTIEAVSIRFKNGVATVRSSSDDSSMQLGVSDMLLSKGTEVQCSFKNVPAGFVPQTIVFLTSETAAPMSYDVAAGEWIKSKETAVSTSSSSVPKTSPKPKPQNSSNDIVDLLENNIIEAEITGGDITYVNLRIRRLVPDVVNVQIPAGSFFVSENPAAQNMVATAEKRTRLTTNGWVNLSIPAACANRPKDIPDGNDKFSVQRSPNQKELAQLMLALGKSGATTLVKQAAVWIVTDNADFDDLGILTTSQGNTRAIWYETTTRAMKICAEAGIDITKKNIWNDKETIVSKLSAGELKNWLRNFGVSKPTQTQSSASTTDSNAAQTANTRPLTIKCVNDIKSGTGVPDTKVHLAYYDKRDSKWVIRLATADASGIARFNIPVGEDKASYAFLVAFTEEKLSQAMNDVDNNKRYTMRMPDDTMELELWIATNGESMTNKKGSVQMWYK